MSHNEFTKYSDITNSRYEGLRSELKKEHAEGSMNELEKTIENQIKFKELVKNNGEDFYNFLNNAFNNYLPETEQGNSIKEKIKRKSEGFVYDNGKISHEDIVFD